MGRGRVGLFKKRLRLALTGLRGIIHIGGNMKQCKTALCALLCLCFFMALCACGEGGYRIIDTYSTEGDYAITFRQGDRLCELVTAAMQELDENGTLRAASLKWFGEDIISIKGKGGEMDELWAEVEPRTVTVGVDITNMPMSYETAEGYLGFDVDLANYICSYLGWNMAIYPIDPANVAIELNSGNIDMAMGIAQDDNVSELSTSPAYITSSYVLVANTGGRIRRRSALKGKTLGVVITDIEILQTDEKFVSSLKGVTYQTNTDGLFQALMRGEVDGILVPSVVAAYYMK